MRVKETIPRRLSGLAAIIALAVLSTAAACPNYNPAGASVGGAASGSLTVGNATPASGNGTLSNVTVVAGALSGTEIEVIIKGKVGAEFHSFDLIIVTTNSSFEQIEHKWASTDPLNLATPDGWTRCDASGAPCTGVTVNLGSRTLTFANMILNGSFPIAFVGNKSTTNGSIVYPTP